MKTFLIFLLSFFCTLNFAYSSNFNTESDTANYPYWINMMQDRSINFYSTQRAFNKYWENREITKGSGWKQFKRWEWIAQQIIDAQGNFPNEEQQYQEFLKMTVSSDLDLFNSGFSTCNLQGNWKELGPVFLPVNNTSQINGMGRLNAVALHPTDTNTFFVGACAGGIWKTRDGGENWSVYTDSLPTLGVSSIAINPNNPDTMYFGSGDRDNSDAFGYGVFKSTDAGNSWTIMNNGMGNQIVGKLIINPKDTRIILAATNNGVYRSTNSAGSWTRTLSQTNTKDIVFMPGNADYVYTTRSGMFYRSTDNGVNWTQITSGLPTTGVTRGVIGVSPLDTTLVYFWTANNSVHQGFYLSRDGGVNFTTMSTTPNLHDYSTNGGGSGGQAWYNKAMTIDPTDAGVIYCGGVNIFKSTDTGRTWVIAGYWVNQIHADQHEMVSCPITNRIFTANDGGLYFSRTKGTPWIPVKTGLAIAQIYKLGASRTQKDILITGFQDNGTGNYNKGWFTSRGGDGMDCAVDQEDNRYSFGELYYGQIFRVFNTSTQATIAGNGINGINESGAWNTPFTLREGLSSTMYVGYKNIWRSTNIKNNPPSWTRISTNLGGVSNSDFHAIENCIANPDILYASRSNNTFYISENVNDATPTWTAITQPVSGLVRIIETDPESENIVYISITNRVYKSLDKGVNWTQINGTLPFNVNAILLDTSSKKKGLYVGTFGGGVWYTDTTLNSWKYFSNGIPPTSRITDLEMYYDTAKDCNCNVLYASTYNRGTWYTSVYQDSSLKPIAKLEPYSTILPCSSKPIKFKSISCNIPTEFKWKFNNSNITFTEGTDSTSENPIVLFNESGIYPFTFIVENCMGSDTLYGSVEILDTAKAVCNTTTTNISTNFGIGIFDVQLAGSSFPSLGTFNEGGYLDQSCNGLVRLKKGEKYPVYIRTGTANDEQVKMYIDYDNNGTLNDTNELVIAPAGGRTNHTDSFTVPMTAISGVPLRMRVRSDYISVSSNPCSTLQYGQTEDFVVFIERDSVYPDFALNETEICEGQTVTFYDSTAIKGGVYLWNFGSGATPSTANTPGPHQVTYISNGFVTVILKVNDETITKDSVLHVKVKPDMKIVLTEGDTSLCEGENLILEALDNNSTQANYQWQFNEVNIQDSTFNKLHKNKITPADSGKYTLMASFNGCTDTAVIEKISVYYTPSANFTINDTAQCLSGNSFTFTNNSSIGSGTLTHNWNFGDATGSTATSPSKSYNNANTYSVKLVSTSTHGCADSLQKSVYVRPQPIVNFTINDSGQCLTGNIFVYTNTSTINSGTMVYFWDLGDAKSSTDTSPVNSYNNAGMFNIKLYAFSNYGCLDSNNKNIFVHPEPIVSFSINDTDQCQSGNSFTFTNNSSISSGTLSHNWNFGDATGSKAISPSKSYSNANAYSVKLISTSTFGCTDSLQKSVFVRPQPNTAFTVNDSGQCLTNNNFQFTNNSGIVSGTLNYFWDFGDSDTSSTISPSKSYNNADTYPVKLLATSDFGCKDSTVKTIFVYPQPNTAFSVNDSDQCLSGNSFIFTNNSSISSGTNSFVWDFGDNGSSTATSPVKSYTNSGLYVVKLFVTSNFGCMDSINKSIQVRAQPSADFTINNIEQCLSGNDFQFINTSAISSGNMNFNWNFDDASSSQSVSPNKMYQNAGNYNVKLVVISDFGCKDSISKTIQVLPQPVADFTINNNEQCLSGNDFNFSNSSSIASGSLSNHWDFGDSTSATIDSPQKSYAGEGSYVVKLTTTSNFGCNDSMSKNVVVRPQPDFNLNLEDTICKNENATFTATSSDNTLSYVWKKAGDANVSSGVYNVPTSDTGNFNLRFVVSNNFSCTDSVEINYEIHELPVLNLGNDTGFCENESFLLILSTGHPGFANIWNNGKNTDTIQVYQAGTYSVNVTDNMGCENTDNFTVNLIQSPQVDLGQDRLLNPSLQINEQLDAGSGFASYLWNTNDTTQSIVVTQTGDYTVEVSNTDGCYEVDSITVRYWNETTSIGEFYMTEKIKIYPNPASTIINILSEEKEMKTIRIYDAAGKIIWMQEIHEKSIQINSENWVAGIYSIEIVMHEKTVNYRLVIVK